MQVARAEYFGNPGAVLGRLASSVPQARAALRLTLRSGAEVPFTSLPLSHLPLYSTASTKPRSASTSNCWAAPVRCSCANPALIGWNVFRSNRPCARVASMTVKRRCR